MTHRKFLGIQKITVNSVDATHILDVEISLVTDDMDEDLAEVKFTPNTIEGIAFKQYGKCWLIKVVHDGFTSIYDSYIDDDGEGTVLPTFIVTFNIVKTAANKTTEVWTFEAGKSYIYNRDDVKAEIEQKRNPGIVYIVCIGDVTHTFV